MKVKIIKTGEVFGLAPSDYSLAWIMVRAGLLEEIKASDKPKKGSNFVLKQQKAEAGPNAPTATWWLDGEGKDTAIHARCSDCKLHEVILNSENAKFEHCGRTEFAPAVVVAQYKKARSIFR